MTGGGIVGVAGIPVEGRAVDEGIDDTGVPVGTLMGALRVLIGVRKTGAKGV